MAEGTALEAIGAARIVPVLRHAKPGEAAGAADRLAQAGLGVVEFTLTTPDWADALAATRQAHPGLVLGVGTVTSKAHLDAAVAAGAQFLVTPFPVPGLAQDADDAGVPLIEGGFTPGELAGVLAHGGVAKLFPASAVGVGYLRNVLAVLPNARILTTGGIRLADARDWLAAGAFAVGVGSDLLAEGNVATRVRDALGDRP